MPMKILCERIISNCHLLLAACESSENLRNRKMRIIYLLNVNVL